MEKTDEVRETALILLVKVFEKRSYSNILVRNLRQKYTPLDRAFISELVYGTIKWKNRIDYIINKLSSVKSNKISPYIMNILRIGLYQIEFMSRVPDSAAVNECVKLARKYENPGAAGFVNGLLRNYIRNKGCIKYPDRSKNLTAFLSIYYSYPEWLVLRLIKELGEERSEEFLKASNIAPKISIRVNKLKISKEELKQKLVQAGIRVEDGLYLEDAMTISDIKGIDNMEEYRSGLFTVQDESSMLVSMVLSPSAGEFIMDLCSAPGTKTTYMAELMKNKGAIVAGDINENKLHLVENNAHRLGIDIIQTIKNDAMVFKKEYEGKADKVLVDAPCSGIGIMRKKPEIRWNRLENDISSIREMQRKIIQTSARYVKAGGVLVYSTCTIFKEENIDIVTEFLNENKDFTPDDISGFLPEALVKDSCRDGYIEIYPNEQGIDGFFIARLRRVDA